MPSVSIAVPRAAGGDRLVDGLAAVGCDVVAVPLVAIESTAAQLDAVNATVAAARQGVLVVTSSNGVHVVEQAGGPPQGMSIAVVGRSTAATAAAAGWRVDVVPQRQTAAALAEHLVDSMSPCPVLYVSASGAGDDLESVLRSADFEVVRVDGYSTVEHEPAAAVVAAAGRCDLVAFTAGSNVRRWVDVFGDGVPGVSIGPSTTAVARDLGQPIIAEATSHDFAGLAATVAGVLGPADRS